MTWRETLRGLPAFPEALPPFDVERTPDAPIALFRTWLREAIDAGEPVPHALTLSTEDNTRVDARVVTLRDIAQNAWWFATSTHSEKGAQIGDLGAVALTWWWPGLGRQVRLRGEATPGGEEDGAAVFLERSPQARAVALAARAGAGRRPRDLRARGAAVAAALETVEQTPDVVDPTWRLFRVEAEEVEFFQGAHDHNHVRLLYSRPFDATGWEKELLWA